MEIALIELLINTFLMQALQMDILGKMTQLRAHKNSSQDSKGKRAGQNEFSPVCASEILDP